MSGGLVVRDNPAPLPTLEGYSTGIVAKGDDRSITGQCAVCLRTAEAHTPRDLVILGRWRFDPDPGGNGWVEYRRCPDCREARRHPLG